ncbi:MAG: carboxyl transferase domain-containing protein, partial [Pseudomonadota bacterium]
MTRIQSQISPTSPQFRDNAAAFANSEQVVAAAAATALEGGGPAARERQRARGKMAPRERVERLLDPGSPFLEIGLFAAHGLYDGDAPAAGVIAGVGLVHGRQVMVVANDATVKGGS